MPSPRCVAKLFGSLTIRRSVANLYIEPVSLLILLVSLQVVLDVDEVTVLSALPL